MRSTPALLLLALCAMPALATDGVLEINQTCAVQTGCFPLDSAGFPVAIRAAGSYRLTSDLDISSTSLIGILVSADDVSIDLNGFAITGRGDGQTGIQGFSTSTSNTTVVNGTIREVRFGGLLLGPGSRVEGVRALANGGIGIQVGEGGLVEGCTVDGHSVVGIDLGSNSLAIRNVIRNNRFGLNGGAYTGNVLTDNTSAIGVPAIQVGTNQCGTNTTCP